MGGKKIPRGSGGAQAGGCGRGDVQGAKRWERSARGSIWWGVGNKRRSLQGRREVRWGGLCGRGLLGGDGPLALEVHEVLRGVGQLEAQTLELVRCHLKGVDCPIRQHHPRKDRGRECALQHTGADSHVEPPGEVLQARVLGHVGHR
jgi:hypothetical protein